MDAKQWPSRKELATLAAEARRLADAAEHCTASDLDPEDGGFDADQVCARGYELLDALERVRAAWPGGYHYFAAPDVQGWPDAVARAMLDLRVGHELLVRELNTRLIDRDMLAGDFLSFKIVLARLDPAQRKALQGAAAVLASVTGEPLEMTIRTPSGINDNPWDYLTETQKRRLWLRFRGYSYRHIARLEAVNEKSVRESLRGCEKKIPSLRAYLHEHGLSPVRPETLRG